MNVGGHCSTGKFNTVFNIAVKCRREQICQCIITVYRAVLSIWGAAIAQSSWSQGTDSCTPYNVHSPVYTVQCTFYSVYFPCVLYFVLCSLYTIQYTLYILHCKIYTLNCKQDKAQYILTVQSPGSLDLEQERPVDFSRKVHFTLVAKAQKVTRQLLTGLLPNVGRVKDIISSNQFVRSNNNDHRAYVNLKEIQIADFFKAQNKIYLILFLLPTS